MYIYIYMYIGTFQKDLKHKIQISNSDRFCFLLGATMVMYGFIAGVTAPFLNEKD